MKERLIIPINMQDGCIIGIGKGNPDWNYSPLMEPKITIKRQAKDSLSVEDFQKDMEGIYTTTANQSTIDESPRAYKSIDDILGFIEDTVEVKKIIKPVYNYKAAE